MTATGFAIPALSTTPDPRSIGERVNALLKRENLRRPFDGRILGFKGDGSDETARFQAAIDNLSGEKARILLPPGRFVISSTVKVSGQISLVGNDWGTVIVPASNGLGTLFNVSGSYTEFRDMMVDASAIVSPTFTAFNYDSPHGGLNRMDNMWIYGAGRAINVIDANANRFSNLRLQQCVTCIQTGGMANKYPGDTTWEEIVCLPTSSGTGWIMDGNTNSQSLSRTKIIGGAKCMHIRGWGPDTLPPDGIFIGVGNYTAATGSVVEITRAFNVAMDANTYIGGSSAGEGLLIDAMSAADVDGINLAGTHVRANAKEGVKWAGGSNFSAIGAKIHGNSQASAGTYSNLYVGANATGLCQIVGCMLGLSRTGEIYGNIAGPAKYGIELAANSLASSGSFIGRLMVVGNIWSGNHVGTFADGSIAGAKVIASNL